MIKGTTKSGFSFQLKEENLDDYELFEVLAALDAGAVEKMPTAIRMLLGEKQKDRLVAHVKKKNNGRASVQNMVHEVNEIFDLAKALKN